MEINLKKRKEITGITYDRKLPNPGVTRVKISHFYALKRGTLTSTASTRTTQALVEQSSLFPKNRPLDLLVSIAPTDPSSTRFRTSGVLSGELRQSHT